MMQRKVVLAGMIGNALEWYDYALYGHFVTIISVLFFPAESAYVSLIATFGVFAAGFAMRPVGAILFGWIGDRYGRKKALSLSILMMAIPTACIGLLPAYAQIGIAAPVLLTLFRLFQGLSLGGELSGSIAFIVEHSQDRHRGLAGSSTLFSAVVGILAGSSAAMLFSRILTEEELYSWGWRVPFLIGLAIGMVGLYIRSCLEESPDYDAAKARGELSAAPVRDVFRHHKRSMLTAIGIYMAVTVPFYALVVFMESFLSKLLHHSIGDASTINTVSMLALLAATPASGWLSDRIGRKRLLIPVAIAMLLLFMPVFGWLTAPDLRTVMLGAVVFAVLVGLFIGPVPALLVELFPTGVRYTGMALSYNICAAVFGGTAPMVMTWLINVTGDNEVGAYYLMLCAALSLITLFFYRDRWRNDVR